MKHLNHPAIINIQAVIIPEAELSRDWDSIYIVMDKADYDLKKLVKSNNHLEIEHVKEIIYNVFCGIKYMHSANILHRDLKPANILINKDCSVYICDFGLSRSLPKEMANQNSEEVKEENKQPR